LDHLAGEELEVGPAQFALDGFIILLGPAGQPVQADDPGHVGARQRNNVTTAGRPDAVNV
jgi:hypothetical protein